MRKKELLCFLTELRQQEVLRINAAIAHERQMETLHKQRHDIGEILGRRVEESTIDAARRVVQSIETCNKLREAAEQREFVSDGRLDRLCEILSATTETVEEAARRAKWKEFELENANQGLLIQLDKLNAEVEDRRQAFAMWSQSTEKVLHRLGSKQGESIEEALNRWLGEHTKNLQTNRNTLRLYEAAMELCEGGMVPSEQIIKLRGLVNTLQQKLADTAERAAIGQLVIAPRDQLIENDELRNANSKLRTEVAELQEKLRASIQKADATCPNQLLSAVECERAPPDETEVTVLGPDAP